jgi:sterol desaturase/sphingolipid hydroxylase (fatty acid hydroxylase superfamily)
MTNEALPAWLPFAAAVWLVQMIAYHGAGLWFEWLDQTGRLGRFKTRPVERRSYFEILPRVLVNQFLLLLPAMMLLEWSGLAFVGPTDLTPLKFLVWSAILTVGHDIVQYVAHRFILHPPSLMRRLGHSLHHTTTGSRAISACYMSAADYFLEIVCPYLIPLIVIGGGGSSLAFQAFIVSVGAFGGLYEHSGYDFSLGLRAGAGEGLSGRIRRILANLASSQAHAAHHARGNVSFSDGFGSSNICDTIFGTRWDMVPRRERQPQSAE